MKDGQMVTLTSAAFCRGVGAISGEVIALATIKVELAFSHFCHLVIWFHP